MNRTDRMERAVWNTKRTAI